MDFMKITYPFSKPFALNRRAGRPQEFILYYLYTGGSCLDGRVKNIYSVLTMKSMEEQFNEEECVRTLRLLSGDQSLEEMPHGDTFNYYLEKLSLACFRISGNKW